MGGLSNGDNINDFVSRWRSLQIFETFLPHIPHQI